MNDDMRNLNSLLSIMEKAPLLSLEQERNLWKNNLEKIMPRMFNNHETYGQASGAPAFLNLPEDDFQAYLKRTNDNLSVQIKIVTDAFKDYLIKGERPAPHYPLRIAIILSKLKRKDKEKEFLSAWCRHFGKLGDKAGEKYVVLAERAKKLGVKIE